MGSVVPAAGSADGTVGSGVSIGDGTGVVPVAIVSNTSRDGSIAGIVRGGSSTGAVTNGGRTIGPVGSGGISVGDKDGGAVKNASQCGGIDGSVITISRPSGSPYFSQCHLP